MGLKNKIAALATTKIVEYVAANTDVDNKINSAMTKINKALEQTSTEDYIERIKNGCMVIKKQSFSSDTVARVLFGENPNANYLNQYQVTDESGNIKYTSKGKNSVLDRDIVTLYDVNGKKIGYIKEHIIAVGELFEKEVKKCSVFLGDEKIAVVKKSVSFKSLNLMLYDGDFRIEHTGSRAISEIFIYRNGSNLAKALNVPLTLNKGFVDKFVVEYNREKDAPLVALMMVALDVVCG